MTTTQTKTTRYADAVLRYARGTSSVSNAFLVEVSGELRRISPMEAELRNLRDEMQALKGFSTGINRALTAEKERSRLAYQAGHNDGVAHHKEAKAHIKTEIDKLLEVNKVLVDALTEVKKHSWFSVFSPQAIATEALKLAGEIKC